MACVSMVAVIVVGYRIGTVAASEQVTIACGPAAPRYCVYHRATPGFLSSTYELVVGTSPNRGLFYKIPYEAGRVGATWDPATRAVTITMPGTTLTIAASEYLDTR